jgi:hypothetical protein
VESGQHRPPQSGRHHNCPAYRGYQVCYQANLVQPGSSEGKLDALGRI